IMSSNHGPGEAFQHKTESARRHVEPAWLEPDPVGVGHPQTVVFQVRIRNEVLTAPSVRFETVGDAVEGDDRHVSSLLLLSKLVALVETSTIIDLFRFAVYFSE